MATISIIHFLNPAKILIILASKNGDKSARLKGGGFNLTYGNKGLDYRRQVESISEEDNLLTDLRKLIIDDFYQIILLEELRHKLSKSLLDGQNIQELHTLAIVNNICFNKVIHKLHGEIENYIDVKDFNSMNISWIIIAYFFEICDIGVHDDNA